LYHDIEERLGGGADVLTVAADVVEYRLAFWLVPPDPYL
jgi:hypothetical protein